MVRRTFLFGVYGAVLFVIVFPLALRFNDVRSFEHDHLYWAVVSLQGFVLGAVANFLLECFGFYKTGQAGRSITPPAATPPPPGS